MLGAVRWDNRVVPALPRKLAGTKADPLPLFSLRAPALRALLMTSTSRGILAGSFEQHICSKNVHVRFAKKCRSYQSSYRAIMLIFSLSIVSLSSIRKTRPDKWTDSLDLLAVFVVNSLGAGSPLIGAHSRKNPLSKLRTNRQCVFRVGVPACF